LPAHYQDKTTWQHVAAELEATATSAASPPAAALSRIALSLEGVEFARERGYRHALAVLDTIRAINDPGSPSDWQRTPPRRAS
jgi:hypothetical protein